MLIVVAVSLCTWARSSSGCTDPRILHPVSCEALTKTAWERRCRLLYPGRGSKGLAGDRFENLEVELDLGSDATVSGVYSDVPIPLSLSASGEGGKWTKPERLSPGGTDGVARLDKPLQ
eukprot:Hpha_TRINITY_DN16993_c1_g1::TRINITY_DN16993_c1_g1_i4::g.51843::m.51843